MLYTFFENGILDIWVLCSPYIQLYNPNIAAKCLQVRTDTRTKGIGIQVIFCLCSRKMAPLYPDFVFKVLKENWSLSSTGSSILRLLGEVVSKVRERGC